jgi:branched-chain amino acid transport system substrate-binding protein
MRALSRRMALATVVLTIAGCTAVGFGGRDAGPLELRIGVLAPLSGPNAAIGTDAVRGAKLAAELISDSSLSAGVGEFPSGLRVTVVAGNTRDNLEEGVRQVTRLVSEEGVTALIGAGAPAVIEAASQRAERLEVPFVSGGTTADFLTERGLAWFFRTAPSARAMAESLYSVLLGGASRPGAAERAVAVLHQDSPESRTGAALLAEMAVEGGFEVSESVEVGRTTGLNSVVAQTLAGNPGGVFLVADTPATARRLVGPFRGAGKGSPVILGFGSGFSDTTFRSGRDAGGVLYTSFWSPRIAERSPIARAAARSYWEQHRQAMTESAAGAFTAVHGLAEAVTRAGATTPAAVRAALLGLDIPGRSTIMPWEGIRFDATGQNTRAIGIVQQRVRNGTRIVFPAGLRDGAPLPPSRVG